MRDAGTIQVSVADRATTELVQAFARLLPQLSVSASPLDASTLEEILQSESNTLLVARDQAHGGAIIGTLTLVVFRTPTAVRAWIEDVVVDGSARGRGVGELLTREAVLIACGRGAHTIDLTSRPSREAARRLYEKVGFKERETGVYRYVCTSGAGIH